MSFLSKTNKPAAALLLILTLNLSNATIGLAVDPEEYVSHVRNNLLKINDCQNPTISELLALVSVMSDAYYDYEQNGVIGDDYIYFDINEDDAVTITELLLIVDVLVDIYYGAGYSCSSSSNSSVIPASGSSSSIANLSFSSSSNSSSKRCIGRQAVNDEDIYVKQSVTFNGTEYEDFCSDENTVEEYYCDPTGDSAMTETKTCPADYTCQFGANFNDGKCILNFPFPGFGSSSSYSSSNVYAEIEVTKTVATIGGEEPPFDNPVLIGEKYTYEIFVQNKLESNSDVEVFNVIDTVPAGINISFDECSLNSGNSYNCPVDPVITVAPGETKKVLTLNVTLHSGVCNMAYANHAQAFAHIKGTTTDVNDSFNGSFVRVICSSSSNSISSSSSSSSGNQQSIQSSSAAPNACAGPSYDDIINGLGSYDPANDPPRLGDYTIIDNEVEFNGSVYHDTCRPYVPNSSSASSASGNNLPSDQIEENYCDVNNQRQITTVSCPEGFICQEGENACKIAFPVPGWLL